MDSVLLVREEGKWIQVTDTALTCTRCLLKEQRTEIIGSCGDCSLNTFWILSCVVLFHSHHKEKYTRLYDPNFSFKRKKKHVRESWGVSSPPCRALSHWACPGGAGTAAGQWAPGAQGSSMSQQTLNVNFFLLFCPSWILLCSPEWLCSPAHVISSVDCLQGKDYHELYAGGKRMLSCFFKSILRKWWRRIEIQSCRHLSLKFSSPFVWKPTQKGRWAGGWGSLSQMWWQRVTRNILDISHQYRGSRRRQLESYKNAVCCLPPKICQSHSPVCTVTSHTSAQGCKQWPGATTRGQV